MLASKLLYFISLAHIESYTKTAEKLEISQPTLSNNISSLEEELGVKLFEKKGRSIMLTAEGKEFLAYAEECVNLLEKGKKAVKNLNADLSGIISLAHINIQTNTSLPSYIKTFIDSNETLNIMFDFYINLSEEIIEGIKKDKYDIGFCFKNKIDSDIEFLPLWKEEFVIIVSDSHPLASRKTVNFKESMNYNHITYSEKSLIYTTVHDYYKRSNCYPKVVGSVESTSAMLGLVSKDVGIGLVPKSIVEDQQGISVLKINDVDAFSTVYMTYAKHKVQLPCVKRFIRYMEKAHRINDV